MDERLLPIICRTSQAGGKAALVTIIQTHGSTPRKSGSQMLVLPDGQIYGTIGGGCAESGVRQRALLALDEGCSVIYKVAMDNDVAAREGMACGGQMELFIQVI